MNAMHDIENGEKSIILGEYIPISLVKSCLKERNWTLLENTTVEDYCCCLMTKSIKNQYVMIFVYLIEGFKTKIEVL